MKRTYLVEVDLPPGVGIWEMELYIQSSIQTMRGSLHPIEDPLFDLDRKSVKVRHATPKRLEKVVHKTERGNKK